MNMFCLTNHFIKGGFRIPLKACFGKIFLNVFFHELIVSTKVAFFGNKTDSIIAKGLNLLTTIHVAKILSNIL